jgi:hypothetical protein
VVATKDNHYCNFNLKEIVVRPPGDESFHGDDKDDRDSYGECSDRRWLRRLLFVVIRVLKLPPIVKHLSIIMLENK